MINAHCGFCGVPLPIGHAFCSDEHYTEWLERNTPTAGCTLPDDPPAGKPLPEIDFDGLPF
jgi:hypothetical protein